MHTEHAHNDGDLNRRVTALEHEVVDLKQRITVLEGDTPDTGTVTTTQAARLLGFADRSAITRRINTGEISAYRTGNRWAVELEPLRRHPLYRPTHN